MVHDPQTITSLLVPAPAEFILIFSCENVNFISVKNDYKNMHIESKNTNKEKQQTTTNGKGQMKKEYYEYNKIARFFRKERLKGSK